MNIPKIPDNSLTEEIKEIVKLCIELDDVDVSEFNPPATNEEIKMWENRNNITLPESYKDWLSFSNGSQILGQLACFYSLNRIVTSGHGFSDDYAIIASIIGDGEFLCFSKTNQSYFWLDHDNVVEITNLNLFLKETIIRMLKKSL